MKEKDIEKYIAEDIYNLRKGLPRKGVSYFNLSEKYTEVCPDCGKSHSLYTQANKMPEYYTSVNIVCDCGELIEFDLPVN